MKNRITPITLIMIFLALMLSAPAQEKKDEPARNVYKLEFTVFELDNGKRINERSYMLQLSDDRHGASTRVGTRVPIQVGGDNRIIPIDAKLKGTIMQDVRGLDSTRLAEYKRRGAIIGESSTPVQDTDQGHDAPVPPLQVHKKQRT